LVQQHLPQLVGEFREMLKEPHRQDNLGRMYHLLAHSQDATRALCLNFKLWIKNVAQRVFRDYQQQQQAKSNSSSSSSSLDSKTSTQITAQMLKSAVPVVQSILALHRRAQAMLHDSFDDCPVFQSKIDEAFTEVMNGEQKPINSNEGSLEESSSSGSLSSSGGVSLSSSNGSASLVIGGGAAPGLGGLKMAELLAMFCHQVLRGKEKMSTSAAEDVLERVVKVSLHFIVAIIYLYNYRLLFREGTAQ
jgi:hypothetical protein